MSRTAVTKTQAVLLVVIIVVAMAAGYYFYSSTVSKPKESITFATWGGQYTDAFNETIKAFEQEFGVEVLIYTQGSSMETVAKIRSEKEHPSVDVFFGGASAGVKGADEGLFVDLTEDTVPNLKHIDAKFRYEKYPSVIPYTLLAEGWYIHPDLIPSDFQFNGTWQWFFDPRLKGKIAVPTPEFSFFIEWASIVAGDYYNYKAGFELIKKLAPNIKVVYSSTPEIEGIFSQGNVWAVNGVYSDAAGIASKGMPVKTLKFYPLVAEPEAMMVVKGGKEALAMKFLNYILDPTNQAKICTVLGSASTNKDSPPLPANLEPFGAYPLDVVYLSDLKYIGDHADEWVEMWNREITPLLP